MPYVIGLRTVGRAILPQSSVLSPQSSVLSPQSSVLVPANAPWTLSLHTGKANMCA